MTPIPDWPIGTPVVVTLDDGQTCRSCTASLPWRLGTGDVIVSVQGMAGGYLLERVRPVAEGEDVSELPWLWELMSTLKQAACLVRADRAAQDLLRISAETNQRVVLMDRLEGRGLVLATVDPETIDQVLRLLAELDMAIDDGTPNWDQPCDDALCGLLSGHGGPHMDGDREWQREEPS